MKKRIKRGFTLFETLILIVIIGILLTIGAGLSRHNLEKLKVKSVSEEFIGFFDTIFLQVNASNYQNGVAYTEIEFTLQTRSNQI